MAKTNISTQEVRSELRKTKILKDFVVQSGSKPLLSLKAKLTSSQISDFKNDLINISEKILGTHTVPTDAAGLKVLCNNLIENLPVEKWDAKLKDVMAKFKLVLNEVKDSSDSIAWNGESDESGKGGTNPNGKKGQNPNEDESGKSGTNPNGKKGQNPNEDKSGKGGTNPNGKKGQNPNEDESGKGGTNPNGKKGQNPNEDESGKGGTNPNGKKGQNPNEDESGKGGTNPNGKKGQNPNEDETSVKGAGLYEYVDAGKFWSTVYTFTYDSLSLAAGKDFEISFVLKYVYPETLLNKGNNIAYEPAVQHTFKATTTAKDLLNAKMALPPEKASTYAIVKDLSNDQINNLMKFAFLKYLFDNANPTAKAQYIKDLFATLKDNTLKSEFASLFSDMETYDQALIKTIKNEIKNLNATDKQAIIANIIELDKSEIVNLLKDVIKVSDSNDQNKVINNIFDGIKLTPDDNTAKKVAVLWALQVSKDSAELKELIPTTTSSDIIIEMEEIIYNKQVKNTMNKEFKQVASEFLSKMDDVLAERISSKSISDSGAAKLLLSEVVMGKDDTGKEVIIKSDALKKIMTQNIKELYGKAVLAATADEQSEIASSAMRVISNDFNKNYDAVKNAKFATVQDAIDAHEKLDDQLKDIIHIHDENNKNSTKVNIDVRDANTKASGIKEYMTKLDEFKNSASVLQAKINQLTDVKMPLGIQDFTKGFKESVSDAFSNFISTKNAISTHANSIHIDEVVIPNKEIEQYNDIWKKMVSAFDNKFTTLSKIDSFDDPAINDVDANIISFMKDKTGNTGALHTEIENKKSEIENHKSEIEKYQEDLKDLKLAYDSLKATNIKFVNDVFAKLDKLVAYDDACIKKLDAVDQSMTGASDAGVYDTVQETIENINVIALDEIVKVIPVIQASGDVTTFDDEFNKLKSMLNGKKKLEKIDSSKLSKVEGRHELTEKEITDYNAKIASYNEAIYFYTSVSSMMQNVSFLGLGNIISDLDNMANEFNGHYQNLNKVGTFEQAYTLVTHTTNSINGTFAKLSDLDHNQPFQNLITTSQSKPLTIIKNLQTKFNEIKGNNKLKILESLQKLVADIDTAAGGGDFITIYNEINANATNIIENAKNPTATLPLSTSDKTPISHDEVKAKLDLFEKNISQVLQDYIAKGYSTLGGILSNEFKGKVSIITNKLDIISELESAISELNNDVNKLNKDVEDFKLKAQDHNTDLKDFAKSLSSLNDSINADNVNLNSHIDNMIDVKKSPMYYSLDNNEQNKVSTTINDIKTHFTTKQIDIIKDLTSGKNKDMLSLVKKEALSHHVLDNAKVTTMITEIVDKSKMGSYPVKLSDYQQEIIKNVYNQFTGKDFVSSTDKPEDIVKNTNAKLQEIGANLPNHSLDFAKINNASMNYVKEKIEADAAQITLKNTIDSLGEDANGFRAHGVSELNDAIEGIIGSDAYGLTNVHLTDVDANLINTFY